MKYRINYWMQGQEYLSPWYESFKDAQWHLSDIEKFEGVYNCQLEQEPEQMDEFEKNYYLSIQSSNDETGGEVCEGQEDDEWPNFEDRYLNPTIHGIVRGTEYHWHSLIVSKEIFDSPSVWTVIVTYYDGSTFGTTYGYLYLAGAFKTKEEAEKMKKSIENNEDVFKDSIFVPWTGYFAGLEEVVVEQYNLRDCNFRDW